MIFTFHHEPSGHKIVCSRCHRPHDDVEPAAEQLCLECHPEHTETWHPTGEGLRCAICHQPHRAPPKGDALCTQCHSQAADVPVHQLPGHPKDCLACHTAHFNTFKLRNGCADCHSDAMQSDLLSQTAGHSDCSGCHRDDDFTFKGNRACANCHKAEGAILGSDQVPEQHQYCRNCHEPHTWRAPFNATCKRCHQAVQVLEHQAAYHPTDCSACHDAHLLGKLPASGDCGGCHTGDDRVPAFGSDAPAPHTECANCHGDDALQTGDFTFAGEAESCLLCHGDPGGGQAWSELPDGHRSCTACHPAHTWQVAAAAQSCSSCHGAIAADAPNASHADCFSCHTGHGLQFGVAGPRALLATCRVRIPRPDTPTVLHVIANMRFRRTPAAARSATRTRPKAITPVKEDARTAMVFPRNARRRTSRPRAAERGLAGEGCRVSQANSRGSGRCKGSPPVRRQAGAVRGNETAW
jgi:hypothetical protein